MQTVLRKFGFQATGKGLESAMEGKGRHSIYTQQGQAQLSASRCEAVNRMLAVVRQLVARVNQKGCGLALEVFMDGPGEGRISFHLKSKPGGKISARVDGGLVIMAGRTCAGREDFQSMIKMIVRNLTLGHFDKVEAPTTSAVPAGAGQRERHRDISPREPGRGLVPVSRPTDTHGKGFVREISLD